MVLNNSRVNNILNLFICNTPLQIIQFVKLIKDNKVKGDFEFLLLFDEMTDQINSYQEKLRLLSSSDVSIKVDGKMTFFYIYKKYNRIKYENIIFSSVDNIFIHYLLSIIKFEKIITIDDGMANICQKSCYYNDNRKISNKIFLKLIGGKYDLRKVKENIDIHYSIYKDKPNIVPKSKVFYNDIFNIDFEKGKGKGKGKAIVILGTSFKEITNNINIVVNKINEYFICYNDIYYIPHPRCGAFFIERFNTIKGCDIAEYKIMELLNIYDEIDLYGFNSTVQYNLEKVDKINNYVFYSSFFNDTYIKEINGINNLKSID